MLTDMFGKHTHMKIATKRRNKHVVDFFSEGVCVCARALVCVPVLLIFCNLMAEPPDLPTTSVFDWFVAPASRIRPCFPTLLVLLSHSLSISYFSLFLPTSHELLHHGIEVNSGLG